MIRTDTILDVKFSKHLFILVERFALMRRLRFLTSRHRAPSTNRMFGLLLAFNAGAINAGGFLMLHVYTSHMTGFASQFADGLVMGDMRILLCRVSMPCRSCSRPRCCFRLDLPVP